MRIRRTVTLLGALSVAAGALSATSAVVPVAAKEPLVVKAVKGELRAPVIHTAQGDRRLFTLSAAKVESARAALAERATASVQSRARTNGQNGSGTPNRGLGLAANSLGCSARNPEGNVRVNQDCTYRRQAEEIIKFNPANPANLVAGQNDSRVGFNHCGFDYSFNSGQTWGDGLPPFWQHLNSPEFDQPPLSGDPNRHTILGTPGTFHTYDAASDPIIAVDADGRAFFGCVVFDVADNANGLIISQSPQGAGGSFFDNVPMLGPRFIVAEDNDPSGDASHDKPFMTADIFKNNVNKNNLYVTWTVFRFDPRCQSGDNPSGQCESPIFGSMSTDHGLTWSTPEQISGTSDVLCPVGQIDPQAPAHSCNQDQGADPIVLPDGYGNLVVVFNNGNNQTSTSNAQELSISCHPTGSSPDGTAHLNCGEHPAKVGTDVTIGEPLCDFGRGPEECIPGAYIRTNDFPRIAVNRGNGHLYATWQDYKNGAFNIEVAQSLDGGATWQEAANPVNPDQGDKDHYFPAIDVVPSARGDNGDRSSGSDNGSNHSRDGLRCSESNGDGQAQTRANAASAAGDHVAISYYRTCRVPNENSQGHVFSPGQIPAAGGALRDGASPEASPGNSDPGVQNEPSDYAVSGGRALDTPYAYRPVSPTFPPPDGIQAGFNGDYSGLTLVGEVAHPIWSDTRNTVPQAFRDQPPGQGVVHDEDVFTVAVRVPDGRGDRD